MSYTFTESLAELRSLLGNQSNLASGSSTRPDQWLRDSYVALCASEHARHFPSLTGVSSSNTINAQSEALSGWTSDDVLYIHTLRDTTNERVIREKGFRTIIEHAYDADAIPRKYARWGSTLYFNTTPTTSANQPATVMYYVIRPAAWTTTNKPSVPEEWQRVILLGAVEIGWGALQNKDKRIEFRELKQNAIREIVHPREFQDDDIEFGVVPTRGPDSEEGIYHGES
jgi:hypothetical protein